MRRPPTTWLKRVAVLLAIAATPIVGGGARHMDAAAVPPNLPREFRGAWITPLSGGSAPDWPSRPVLPVAQQQAELRALLDRARAVGLNAVVLHVRLAGDALYPTRRAPWSALLTGRSGTAPSPAYDPLQFAIDEAHARGLQLHAWFNPFRAMLPAFEGKAAASHVTRANPRWVRRYGTQRWIDPGEPEARAAVLATIFEVVERYDIDAVHIDDYFYPYREQHTVTRVVRGRRVRVREDIPFPDATTWSRYGANKGFASRAAWRRANVDGFVRDLYRGVKARKPWVAVGISPFGIWKSGTPAGVTGLDAHGEIYADARKWLREGWLDYLAPQLYWQLGSTQNRFARLDAWWRTENVHDRHIWPGLFTSKVVMPASGWSPYDIVDQVGHLRGARVGTSEAPGHIHFKLNALTARAPSLGEMLRAGHYADLALVPAMPWLSRGPAVTARVRRDGSRLTLIPSDSARLGWWVVQALGADGRWSASVYPRTLRVIELAGGAGRPSRIAVTPLDRTGVGNAPALVDIPADEDRH